MVTDATNSLQLHFTPTKNGLYYTLRGPSSDGQEKWSLVNTISDNKDMYTKREVKAAARSRRFQNIIMFPRINGHLGSTAVGPYCSSILRSARYRTIPSEHAHTLFVEADKLTQLRLIRLSVPPRGRFAFSRINIR
jgi:hypothetical protein